MFKKWIFLRLPVFRTLPLVLLQTYSLFCLNFRLSRSVNWVRISCAAEEVGRPSSETLKLKLLWNRALWSCILKHSERSSSAGHSLELQTKSADRWSNCWRKIQTCLLSKFAKVVGDSSSACRKFAGRFLGVCLEFASELFEDSLKCQNCSSKWEQTHGPITDSYTLFARRHSRNYFPFLRILESEIIFES